MKKFPQILQFQNHMDCVILLRFFFVFSLLCCKYIYDIYLSMLLMAYGSSIAYLFTRLQKTFGSCEPKEE